MPKYRHLDLITAVFVAVLLITQTTASKIAQFGPISISAGVLLFPISYIFGDVLTEVYGYARSRRVIWIGFGCSAIMSVVYWIVTQLPPAPGWAHQSEFVTVLGVVPRVALGSLAGYLVGEFVNSFVLAKMKVATKGRFLWARTISSTIFGQAVDTAVVMFVAFYGILPTSLLLSVAFNLYWIKVLYEVLATPVTYIVVNFIKKSEGVDVYDTHTNFNPFKVAASEDVN